LDGSSNVDINAPVGSIFSVLKAPNGTALPTKADFLQPGSQQLCAGYAIYGATTMLVFTVGRGVHGFTLDRGFGEFILTHPNMRIPDEASEFAIQRALLGTAGEALRGGMLGRTGRRARTGFQHAVDRLVGGGGPSDTHSGRLVHVS
jgi:fructose-1,6-bisphosphatase